MSKWIPVEEKLPTEFEPVLVTALTPLGGSYVNICMLIEGEWYKNIGEEPISLKIVAWRKKPKPYGHKGEYDYEGDAHVNRIVFDLEKIMRGEKT